MSSYCTPHFPVLQRLPLNRYNRNLFTDSSAGSHSFIHHTSGPESPDAYDTERRLSAVHRQPSVEDLSSHRSLLSCRDCRRLAQLPLKSPRSVQLTAPYSQRPYGLPCLGCHTSSPSSSSSIPTNSCRISGIYNTPRGNQKVISQPAHAAFRPNQDVLVV